MKSVLTRQWRAALHYAEQYGWRMFPLAPAAKRPLLSKLKGGRGCHDATNDRGRLLDWARGYPAANIGLATGPASNLLVVDVDAKGGGFESLARLLSKHGSLPQSVEQVTANDGRHILFQWRDDFHDVPQVKLAPGIDLRVAGGHIVVAPSVLSGGRQYTWDPPPWRQPVADAPSWLVELLPRRCEPHPSFPAVPRATGDIAERARRYVSKMPAAISGSGGHKATFAAALALVQGFGLNEDDALELLTEYSERCKPRWSKRELEHKIANAKAANRVTPGWLLRGRAA